MDSEARRLYLSNATHVVRRSRRRQGRQRYPGHAGVNDVALAPVLHRGFITIGLVDNFQKRLLNYDVCGF